MTVSSLIGITSPKAMPDKDFDKAIQKFLSYTGVKLPKDLFDGIDDKYEYLYKIPTFLGVEVEVEGVNHKANLPSFWQGKMDGSLRGPQEERAEFCTIPLTPRQAMLATALLWAAMKALGEPSFSWRTSVHDHLNVIDLKEHEIKNLMVLSALFEPVMFNYAGQQRAKSVFCVPLTESASHQLLCAYLRGRVGLKKLAQEDWYKYSSVNMARMFPRAGEEALGTVEFRHMGGTGNVSAVLRWHSVVLQLFKACIAMPFPLVRESVLAINNEKRYRDFLYQTFTSDVADYLEIGNFQSLLTGPIAKVKELFATPPKLDPVKQKSALAAYAAHINKRKLSKKKKAPTKKSLADMLHEQIAHQNAVPIIFNSVDSFTTTEPPNQIWSVPTDLTGEIP